MLGQFWAKYLNEEEFKSVIGINKRFEPSYKPYLLIDIKNYLNADIFEGTILLDEKYISKWNESSIEIMKEYYEQKRAAFTFDGISYFKIINIATPRDREGILVFTFRYISKPSFTEKNTAFMVMPFANSKLYNFFLKNIKEYLENSDLKIKVYRSDDFSGTDVIADTIKEQIRKVEFVLCDITSCNKNVFFEAGFADGINKNIIFLLEQNKPPEFFDVNHIRRIEYSYEREAEFQKILHATLVSVRNNRPY